MTEQLQTKLERIKAECRKAIEQKPWTVEDHGGEPFLISPDGWDDGYRADYPEQLAEAINRRSTFSPAAAKALLTTIESAEERISWCQKNLSGDTAWKECEGVLYALCHGWTE